MEKANYTICNCMQVTRGDVEDAMQQYSNLDNVEDAFEKVQDATKCSTGCGGCYGKVLDAISDILQGN